MRCTPHTVSRWPPRRAGAGRRRCRRGHRAAEVVVDTAWRRCWGAIATGVGVIGFVTFIGGVTVYARLRAAGFPAAPALGIFPSQDLVVIGAQTLVPEILWALGVVVAFGLAYAVSPGATSASAMRRRRCSPATRRALRRSGCSASSCSRSSCRPARSSATSTPSIGGPRWVSCWSRPAGPPVANVTRRFVDLATTTFLLVGVFRLHRLLARGPRQRGPGRGDHPRQQEAGRGALRRRGSGWVYLARVSLVDESACKQARGSGAGCQIIDDRSRLVGIEKDQVSDIALGDPKAPWRALEQARHLELELCDLQVQHPAQGC